MSYEQLAQAVEDLSVSNDALIAQSLATQVASDAAKDAAEQAAISAANSAAEAGPKVNVADLANATDPLKGAGMNGFGLSLAYTVGTVGYSLKRAAGYWPIEASGVTGTADDSAVIQAAVNYSAANNLVLTGFLPAYFIDQVTIPSGFKCDLHNAQMVRISGTTPKDMWINADIVNGNTGLDIRNVRFDGRRQLNSLTNVTVAHRFCGLRLVKCSGYLENIRADNTVNGEVQAEGTRGGIMLDRSVDIRAYRLFADGTAGTGVFPYQGKNYIQGVWTKNNTGSGFTSSGSDDNDFHHIYSDGSGYSGVSVNGLKMRCSFLSSKNSPLNYAGVNIGHDADGNRATGSQISNVMVESALGWGIVVTGSPNVIGTAWKATGSTSNNLRVVNSPGLKVDYTGENSLDTDTFFSGVGWHFGDFTIKGSGYSGLATSTVSGTKVEMLNGSYITGCGTAGGTTGAVNAANNTEIIVRGRITDNLTYGVISAGGTGALVTMKAGTKISGNTSGNTVSLSGGVLRYEGAKFSDDAMSGSLTIPAGSSSVLTNNGNILDPNRLMFTPSNAAARTAGLALVQTYVPGVSFTAQIAANAASDAIYRWTIV
jgi:hypothetical protein